MLVAIEGSLVTALRGCVQRREPTPIGARRQFRLAPAGLMSESPCLPTINLGTVPSIRVFSGLELDADMKRIAMAVPVILFGLGGGTVFGQTLRVPFDFSQSEIGIDATVNGEPLYILLDTGVDPSAIDLERAGALHLKIDRNAGGQVSGFGNTEQPTAFPTTIQGFAISGHKFGSFDALASDLSALSAKYGRRVDAFIGANRWGRVKTTWR